MGHLNFVSLRLQHLPSQIGLLKNLKELHIRRNCLKYFPMSITELPLYTFSGKYAPPTLIIRINN